MRILPSGEPCLSFESLDSTNAEARRRAQAGERGPLWLTARIQTAGRGRRGRRWVSEPGNLFATHLGPGLHDLAKRPQLSLVAGLAVAEALTSIATRRGGDAAASALRCKWPNDVLIGPAKLAGILLDSEADWIATGIGVNLVSAPEEMDRPAGSLSGAIGVRVSPEEALDAIADRYALRREEWAAHGFAVTREAWLAMGPEPGSGVRVRTGADGAVVEGRFGGLDADGALLLEAPGGTQTRITAGEIVA